MESNYTLTVFTPAYNRAHTIERTYKSLCRQTNHDFMWIIVDDGSTDETRKLCETWFSSGFVNPNENEIVGFSKDATWLKLYYIYKENGGMHTAHNVAYNHIDTELSVCIDSDDWMPDNAVELIVSKWRRDGKDCYAGMIGLDMFEDGYIVGTCFPKDLKSCKTYDLERKYDVRCDKKYVYRPDVIKKYLPYPVFPGERYGTVNFLYQKIDHDYDMLCSNDIYCIVDYQEDGLSYNAFNQHKQSPLTRAYECEVYMDVMPYFQDKIKKSIQYVSCAILARKLSLLWNTKHKFLVWSCVPLGIAYNIYLRRQGLRDIDTQSAKIFHYTEL